MYRLFFPVSLFLSAGLLFIIQPIVAKILLPIYGGTPAVWTVCVLFFQALLLIAYAYAWTLSRLRGRNWRLVHFFICLLSLAVLPLAFVPVSGEGIPEIQILKDLLTQLGLPLLVIGASAPLLQYAFSQTASKRSADPYFLYVASNCGSLLALLAYPWLVERFTGIQQQFRDWNIIYLIYVGFLFYLLWGVRYEPNAQSLVKTIKKIDWRQRAYWIFLSFIPCSLMLGATFYISTDVAATPLLWVLPLVLYLLSFILMFTSKPIVPLAWLKRNALFFLIFPLLGFIIGANQIQAVQLIVAHLACFFILALLCHGELAKHRPPVQQLTEFYFCLSLGGVIAGLFNGFIAPRLFVSAFEYPFVLLLALLVIPIHYDNNRWLRPGFVSVLLLLNHFLPESVWGTWLQGHHVIEILALTLIMVWPGNTRSLFFSVAILFIFLFVPWFKSAQVLSQQRNFYGIKQVFSQAGAHVFMSQSTLHGFQVELDKKPTDGARAYYGVIFPVVQQLQAIYQPLNTLVLGLGTGMMACQFREHDKLTMVEIDDQVIEMAKNPALFTYLRDCPPNTTLIKNDGLLAATKAADAAYELLVMDAFSSDAIPVHLLTKEAFSLYKQKITPDGVILVNISNRHLRILPVLTGAARALDMIILYKSQPINNHLGQFAAEWVLLTTNERLAGHLLGQGWHFVADNEARLWTNDYSNLISLLKW